MSKRKTYTADDLVGRIRTRYAETQRYVVMEQVANGTGSHCNSWIDVVVVSLWPTDGLIRRAFEVKVARNDFLRELADPGKNQWARDSFHEFWFVAPTDVIKEDELPEGAGWLRPHGDGLAVVRAAGRRESPENTDHLFGAMCRAMVKEQEGRESRARREFFEHDPTYLRAKAWWNAGRALLMERHTSDPDDDTPAAILGCLRTATEDKQRAEERDHITSILADFQAKWVELFNVFCVLAHTNLLERDEEGRLITRSFRIDDAAALAIHRATASTKGAWGQEQSARIVRCREFLNTLLGERAEAQPEANGS